MLKDITLPKSYTYTSKNEFDPFRFHLECLLNASSLDLLLGYFSSSAIRLLSIGFASFIHRNGKIRLAINNILSEKDKSVFEKGKELNIPADLIDLTNLKQLKESFSEYNTHFFECLAWLIANNKIEFVIISPKEGKGISHYKEGVYSDGVDKIAFSGSQNFTAYGLTENLETLECFPNWIIGNESRVEEKAKRISDTIELKRTDVLEYLDINDIKTEITSNFGSKELEELLVNEKQLFKKVQNISKSYVYEEVSSIIDEQIEIYESSPRFPYKEGPREYQKQAYQNWVDNDYKGLFAMATGTGKTLTSLNCLLNLYKEHNSYKAIIIVPTIALVNQWKEECEKFNFKNIITVNSKEKWPQNISFLNSASNFIDVSFVIIITYASFYRKKFQNHFENLPNDTLLIADEAHNLGSRKVAKVLPKVHLNKRIGLSATPDRKFDEQGNQHIEEFFNDKPPFIYSYTMEQALNKGWLCQYEYYPHIVKLTSVELAEYVKKSKQLLKYFDNVTKTYKDCKEVEMLLLERKRIIHKAFNKLEIFKDILREEFTKRKSLKYSLVYVPEGIEPNYENIDEITEDSEDISLINDYTRAVSSIDSSIMVKQYTSKTNNRDQVIIDFQNGEIDVLTSMKCLDEGVDVPRSELAIFCASTGNPRQFIQRRGRVLRTHPDKLLAVIHDLVVIAEINDESTFEMERNLIKKELERVVDFSNLAINKIETYNKLKSILDYYNINLNY